MVTLVGEKGGEIHKNFLEQRPESQTSNPKKS